MASKKQRIEYEGESDSVSSYDEVCDISDSETDEDDLSESDEGESWSLSGEAREPFPTDSDLGKVNVNIPFLDRNPESIFEYFFTQEVIESIVLHTNIYASETIKKKRLEGSLKTASRCRYWKDTDCDEVKLFIALLILQGVVKKPTMQLYFTKNEMLATPFFRQVMKRDRFLLLLSFIHFTIDSDQSRKENDYHFFQIVPLLNHLKEKWQEIYTPERDISIDESLLLWKGRGLTWRTFMPRKRARMGVKSYLLCESSTGYVYDMMIYTGESTLMSDKVKDLDLKGFNKTSRVVLTLMESRLDKGHRLFLDNFYSSPKLYDTLARYKTDVVGTVRMNRKGLPSGMKNKVLNPGEVCSWYRGRLMALKWHDKRDVCMLSTIHDGSMRSIKTKRRKARMKPAAVLDYNKGMGGVDLADHCISNYAVKKNRLKKFYMKMFLHLLEITVFNSHIIYNKYGANTTHLNFILNLVTNLTQKYSDRIKPKKNDIARTRLSSSKERHFMTFVPVSSKDEGRLLRKACYLCRMEKKRKDTKYRCAKCNVTLCLIPCFEIYHRKNNLAT